MSDQASDAVLGSQQAAQLVAATSQLSSTSRGVQIKVLSTQAQTSTNGASAATASSLLTTGSGQEVSATLASQLGAFRLPADQQKQLLLAHLQQLKSTVTSTIPASILLQPAAASAAGTQLQGLTVVTTTPPITTTTAKGSGQFVSPYLTEASGLPQSSGTIGTSTMMGLPQQLTGAYYDPTQQMQAGMTHVSMPHTGDHHMTHSTRAHPQTIQWLLENYETAEGVSLPRSTLYNHYLRHCAANKIDAVNAASFGKLIRSVFIGLKTRRLGTRGNSKYHYYGIRIKPDSPLNTFPSDDSPAVAMRQPSQSGERDYQGGDVTPEGADGGSQPDPTPQQLHRQYLGDSRPELPPFPEIQWAGTPIPGAVVAEDLNDFTALYREHCEAILDVVVNLQFQMVESLWHHFWADCKLEIQQPVDDEMEQIPKDKLILLAGCEPVVEYLSACDHMLYQCIVDFLVPEVLSPIPGTLTQAIRNFAKSLESWLTNTIQGYPTILVKSKICSVVAFSQTLRRYTSLNHLAQAARAVLQNPTQISQMLADLNRVDFGNVQEQASWVCECDESLVVRLEHDFKTTLQQQNTLEQWAAWLEGVVNTVLEPYEGGGHEFTKSARQFLLKWSFYSSMVIRDLTLRSAASFGSFHLIRLLYDEYMFFLIEHKVAKATGRTPIAVMSEFSGHSRSVFSTHDSLSGSETQEEEEPQAKRHKLGH